MFTFHFFMLHSLQMKKKTGKKIVGKQFYSLKKIFSHINIYFAINVVLFHIWLFHFIRIGTMTFRNKFLWSYLSLSWHYDVDWVKVERTRQQSVINTFWQDDKFWHYSWQSGEKILICSKQLTDLCDHTKTLSWVGSIFMRKNHLFHWIECDSCMIVNVNNNIVNMLTKTILIDKYCNQFYERVSKSNKLNELNTEQCVC